MDIAAAGALIRSAEDELPICNSKEHKEIGYDEKCLQPLCGSEEYKAIGIEQDCINPICDSKNHESIGLDSKCTKPVCNSSDHEEVGLDKDCIPICDSAEHKAIGVDQDCRKVVDESKFVLGSTIANAWMYDGDTWNNIQPLSTPRENMACGLVQTETGVSYNHYKLGTFLWLTSKLFFCPVLTWFCW